MRAGDTCECGDFCGDLYGDCNDATSRDRVTREIPDSVTLYAEFLCLTYLVRYPFSCVMLSETKAVVINLIINKDKRFLLIYKCKLYKKDTIPNVPK